MKFRYLLKEKIENEKDFINSFKRIDDNIFEVEKILDEALKYSYKSINTNDVNGRKLMNLLKKHETLIKDIASNNVLILKEIN